MNMVKKEKPNKELHQKEYEEIEGYDLNDALVITIKKLNDFIALLQTDYLPKITEIDNILKDFEKRINALETQVG